MPSPTQFKHPPILIAGPTASGKSALALHLAHKHDGIIINADALQVYSHYQILTARPDAHDLRQAPHQLYGHVVQPEYSVGDWLRDVRELIQKTDQQLIFVGGTGLYFRALTQGLAEIPNISDETRAFVVEFYENNGLIKLNKLLNSNDSYVMNTIDHNNPRRVMRALEVVLDTGKSLRHWQEQTPAATLPLEQSQPICLLPDAKITDEWIAQRMIKMLENGAIDEVRAQTDPWLADAGYNKAIGAKNIYEYICGKIDIITLENQLFTETRRYAKRQRSWFRSNMRAWKILHNPKDWLR